MQLDEATSKQKERLFASRHQQQQPEWASRSPSEFHQFTSTSGKRARTGRCDACVDRNATVQSQRSEWWLQRRLIRE